MSSRELILIIGATGAQGIAVIDSLLSPSTNGTPSPYAIRALTRDPSSKRALALTQKGVECIKGSFDDFPSVERALQGCYGAYVNTDGFTVGEMKETYCGMKIFEIAKRIPTMRHFVWANLDYSTKKGGYNPDYSVDHYDGKGRVGEWLKTQPSVVSDDDMSWSCLTTGPYMDMLNIFMFGPLNRRKDGTFVFAAPVGDGHVPMISLSDLGWFTRYIFDHRAETSAQDLEVASEVVGWDHLVKTFTRVTGQPAVYKRLTIDEWWENFTNTDRPAANEREYGDGSTTARQNFTKFWRLWRDDVIHRDMDWLRSIHPGLHSLESWMKDNQYSGVMNGGLLKNAEDGKGFSINPENIARL